MAEEIRLIPNKSVHVYKTVKVYYKPAEWFLNVIKLYQYLYPTITTYPNPTGPFKYPFPNHVPHLAIENIREVAAYELNRCENFYKKHCLNCREPEVVCIVETDYINNLMRYKQLRTCIIKMKLIASFGRAVKH